MIADNESAVRHERIQGRVHNSKKHVAERARRAPGNQESRLFEGNKGSGSLEAVQNMRSLVPAFMAAFGRRKLLNGPGRKGSQKK
jgi:hypothetical protein